MTVLAQRFADLLGGGKHTKQKLLGAAIAAALVFTGCSSDETASTTVAPATEETTTTTTTESPDSSDSTEAPSTSSPPKTTDAPTEETTTTAPPESTAPGADEADLTAALAAHTAGWLDCVAAVPQCDVNTLAATRAGNQLETSVDIILGANTNGWSISNSESYQTQLVAVVLVDDRTAEVTACNEDGLVVTDRTGERVNEEFSSNVTVWTFELLDGAWKATTGVETDRAIGQENSLCAF